MSRSSSSGLRPWLIHAIDRLVESPRKGFWHFERVHRIVLESKMTCTTCHAEMSPFRPGNHWIDRVAQVDSCAHCHLPRSR